MATILTSQIKTTETKDQSTNDFPVVAREVLTIASMFTVTATAILVLSLRWIA